MEICAKLPVSHPPDHITLVPVLKTMFVMQGQGDKRHGKHSCMTYLDSIYLQTAFKNEECCSSLNTK